ncbi:hypothetical protein BGX26_004440 [Mortierella sp. AD094]|nr:hypothetical protein BGX26_004440 [Mortierella sp. AD094]
MAESGTQEAPQIFRLVHSNGLQGNIIPSSRTVNIEPRFDTKTGEYIILWNDINAAFKNSIHVRNVDTVVPFLTDENFEFIKPLRIRAKPNVILDIVLELPIISPSVESLMIADSPFRSSSPSQSEPRGSNPAISVVTASGSQVLDTRPGTLLRTGSVGNNEPLPTDGVDQPPGYTSEDRNTRNSFFSGAQSPSLTFSSDRSVAGILRDRVGEGSDDYEQGLEYYHGKGVPVDYNVAKEWFLEASHQGHIAAQCYLGFMTENGQGMNQDNIRATEWYIKAGSHGYNCDHPNAGVRLEYSNSIQNYGKALSWYREAADKGDAIAQCILGFIHQHGSGILNDHTKAAEWYRRAASQGYANAQNNMGVMYHHGKGVAKDYAEAFEYFHSAAVQGHARAQNNIGIMYQLGHGVTKHRTKAAEWYIKSMSQGYRTAQENLESMARA